MGIGPVEVSRARFATVGPPDGGRIRSIPAILPVWGRRTKSLNVLVLVLVLYLQAFDGPFPRDADDLAGQQCAEPVPA